MFRPFDVPVEHGGIRAEAELVGLAMNLNPAVGVGLVLAELVPDFGMKDFRSAAGKTAEAGVLELGEDVGRRSAGEPREPVPLDGGVSLQVKARVGPVQDAD